MYKKNIGSTQKGSWGNLREFNLIFDEDSGDFYVEFIKETGDYKKSEFEDYRWSLKELKEKKPEYYAKAVKIIKPIFD
jgi:hypothetical protein